jgi:D-alanyl-D-alanine carboxypeptidase
MRLLRDLIPVFAMVAALAVAVPARADIATSAEHAIIMDGETGQALWAKDAETPTPPASMSKLMTLDILFQELKDGRVKRDEIPDDTPSGAQVPLAQIVSLKLFREPLAYREIVGMALIVAAAAILVWASG